MYGVGGKRPHALGQGRLRAGAKAGEQNDAPDSYDSYEFYWFSFIQEL